MNLMNYQIKALYIHQLFILFILLYHETNNNRYIFKNVKI